MSGRCWDWCSKKHKHIRGTGVAAGLGVRREFMNAAERQEIFNKTGVRVEDRADMRAAYASKNLREAEKGELDYERIDALKDSAESGKPLDARYGLENIDLYGDRAQEDKRMKDFNIHKRYEYHRRMQQELGIRD